MASPHYGERGDRTGWMSYGLGRAKDTRQSWGRGRGRIGDYAIRPAFSLDPPFPEFVREQLAGDATLGDWLSQAATGVLGGWDARHRR